MFEDEVDRAARRALGPSPFEILLSILAVVLPATLIIAAIGVISGLGMAAYLWLTS